MFGSLGGLSSADESFSSATRVSRLSGAKENAPITLRCLLPLRQML